MEDALENARVMLPDGEFTYGCLVGVLSGIPSKIIEVASDVSDSCVTMPDGQRGRIAEVHLRPLNETIDGRPFAAYLDVVLDDMA